MHLKLKTFIPVRQIFYIFISLFLLSCSSQSIKIDDGGLISGKPCSAPCFLGIQPDITTKSQTISILEQQGIYEFCNDDLSGSYISCEDRIYVYYNSKGLVSDLTFTPTNPITVKDIINKYGNPDLMCMGINSDIPEDTTIGMSLLYDKNHILIALGRQEGISFSLKEETQIVYVRYYNNFSYFEVKNNLFDRKSNWKGFVKY